MGNHPVGLQPTEYNSKWGNLECTEQTMSWCCPTTRKTSQWESTVQAKKQSWSLWQRVCLSKPAGFQVFHVFSHLWTQFFLVSLPRLVFCSRSQERSKHGGTCLWSQHWGGTGRKIKSSRSTLAIMWSAWDCIAIINKNAAVLASFSQRDTNLHMWTAFSIVFCPETKMRWIHWPLVGGSYTSNQNHWPRPPHLSPELENNNQFLAKKRSMWHPNTNKMPTA